MRSITEQPPAASETAAATATVPSRLIICRYAFTRFPRPSLQWPSRPVPSSVNEYSLRLLAANRAQSLLALNWVGSSAW